MNIDDEIIKIKRELDSINTKKIQTATKLKTLEEEKERLLIECQTLGINPKDIEEELQIQETLLTKEINDIRAQLDQYAVKS